MSYWNYLYPPLRKILFQLDPENSHKIALFLGSYIACCLPNIKHPSKYKTDFAGVSLPIPVGLGAGMDKDGTCIDFWHKLGFGFVEVGTVTPKPQGGNDKPRLFRLIEDEAIINRFGFNSLGAKKVAENLRKAKKSGVVGINIGKNKDTPNENAVEDYKSCLQILHEYADYITINISSPNTQGLRDLQTKEYLSRLVCSILEERSKLRKGACNTLPIIVKLSPDLSSTELLETLVVLQQEGIDGVILSNTTVTRQPPLHSAHHQEEGGLSGKPLSNLSLSKIRHAHQAFPNLPIIGSGGICDMHSAKNYKDAGASAIQINTSLIYQGPAVINAALKAWG